MPVILAGDDTSGKERMPGPVVFPFENTGKTVDIWNPIYKGVPATVMVTAMAFACGTDLLNPGKEWHTTIQVEILRNHATRMVRTRRSTARLYQALLKCFDPSSRPRI